MPWSSAWDHIAPSRCRLSASPRTLEKHSPPRWLDLDYEELVGDLEGQSRRLVGFLGLDWDPACLSPLNRRVSWRTPAWCKSAGQYSDSVGIWRKYEPYVGGFFRGVRAPWRQGRVAAPIHVARSGRAIRSTQRGNDRCCEGAGRPPRERPARQRGRRTTKRLPRPGSLSAVIVPPCVAAMRRATARPSPTPARPSRRADSAR